MLHNRLQKSVSATVLHEEWLAPLRFSSAESVTDLLSAIVCRGLSQYVLPETLQTASAVPWPSLMHFAFVGSVALRTQTYAKVCN